MSAIEGVVDEIVNNLNPDMLPCDNCGAWIHKDAVKDMNSTNSNGFLDVPICDKCSTEFCDFCVTHKDTEVTDGYRTDTFPFCEWVQGCGECYEFWKNFDEEKDGPYYPPTKPEVGEVQVLRKVDFS